MLFWLFPIYFVFDYIYQWWKQICIMDQMKMMSFWLWYLLIVSCTGVLSRCDTKLSCKRGVLSPAPPDGRRASVLGSGCEDQDSLSEAQPRCVAQSGPVSSTLQLVLRLGLATTHHPYVTRVTSETRVTRDNTWHAEDTWQAVTHVTGPHHGDLGLDPGLAGRPPLLLPRGHGRYELSCTLLHSMVHGSVNPSALCTGQWSQIWPSCQIEFVRFDKSEQISELPQTFYTIKHAHTESARLSSASKIFFGWHWHILFNSTSVFPQYISQDLKL